MPGRTTYKAVTVRACYKQISPAINPYKLKMKELKWQYSG